MLILEGVIGRLEVVIEKHDTTQRGGLKVSHPTPNELILDISYFSLMITWLGRKTKPISTLAKALIMFGALTGGAVAAKAVCPEFVETMAQRLVGPQ